MRPPVPRCVATSEVRALLAKLRLHLEHERPGQGWWDCCVTLVPDQARACVSLVPGPGGRGLALRTRCNVGVEGSRQEEGFVPVGESVSWGPLPPWLHQVYSVFVQSYPRPGGDEERLQTDSDMTEQQRELLRLADAVALPLGGVPAAVDSPRIVEVRPDPEEPIHWRLREVVAQAQQLHVRLSGHNDPDVDVWEMGQVVCGAPRGRVGALLVCDVDFWRIMRERSPSLLEGWLDACQGSCVVLPPLQAGPPCLELWLWALARRGCVLRVVAQAEGLHQLRLALWPRLQGAYRRGQVCAAALAVACEDPQALRDLRPTWPQVGMPLVQWHGPEDVWVDPSVYF